MCGINGTFDPQCRESAERLERLVARMSDALSHRGPDDTGSWIDPRAGIALSQRRLAILDLSAEGHQPMHSESGRFVITFNGEIYNFAELRSELEGSHRFRGHSDTEVMLAAFEQWGVAASVRRFNGMFAFAVWDRAEGTLTLARDRLGEKPLYYGWAQGTLLFGSELKALRAHPAFDAQIDRDALSLYVRFNYVPAPKSIYRGIYKLPPATLLSFRSGHAPGHTPDPLSYWSLREVAERGVTDRLRIDEAEATEMLDRLLRDAVRLRMVADVPLGAFLSGGVDSSTIVALMQAESSRPVRTFTIGFAEQDYDEAGFAKQVAEHLRTDHTELYVRPEDALAVIPRLPQIYDEPFADSSQIPTVLVSELARRSVTVALSGDGGDELFGGYLRYQLARDLWRGLSPVPTPIRRVLARSLRSIGPATLSRHLRWLSGLTRRYGQAGDVGDKLHKLAEALSYDQREALYARLMSQWTEQRDGIVVGGVCPPTPLSDGRTWPRDADYTEWMMYVDGLLYLPDDILVKVDRASMSVALEVRVPMLDHRVVELAWRLPPPMRLRGSRGKWLLREVLDRYVPRSLVERPKKGFGVPIDAWLRGPLRGWAEEMLDERRLRDEGFFQVDPIRQRWREHLSGARDWDYPLWNLLMFEAWLSHTRAAAAVPEPALTARSRS